MGMVGASSHEQKGERFTLSTSGARHDLNRLKNCESITLYLRGEDGKRLIVFPFVSNGKSVKPGGGIVIHGHDNMGYRKAQVTLEKDLSGDSVVIC